MRFLIIGINFSPELTGIGKYTGEMAAYLAKQGHEVRVVTAPPYYPWWRVQPPYHWWGYRRENWRGIEVWRSPLWVPRRVSGLKRVLHLASFALFSAPLVLAQVFWGPDMVFVVAPALSAAPFALLAARLSGAKAWLHIQDFEVDAALQLNILPKNNLLTNWAKRAEQALLRRFDIISTISTRMLDRLLDKGVAKIQTYLFPNWVNLDEIVPLDEKHNKYRDSLGISDQDIVVLYAGNMGKKQGIEYIVEAANTLREHSFIHFVLCGDGAVRDEMVQLATGLKNLHFLPLQPADRLNDLLNMADIHVLPQRAEAADLVMPSKLTGMMASGKAIIAMAEKGTEIEQVISKTGIVITPEDTQALSDAILDLAKNRHLRRALGLRAREYAESHWGYRDILDRVQAKMIAVTQNRN